MLSGEVKGFIVSDTQRQLDLAMLPYDLWGSIAHTIMLHRTKIIDKGKAKSIIKALKEIEARWNEGRFQIDPERGAQLTLEKEVVAIAGEEAGLSMHTARSRNDQVMVTELLYLRERALELHSLILDLLDPLAKLGIKLAETVMPGYTHMQPGKPTTIGHWCLAHYDSLVRGAEKLQFVVDQFDRNPLGSVESFGTSWPIDRRITTDLLGFKDTWEVTLDAISNRGVFQHELLGACSLLALSISRIAHDLMLFSTHEYGMVEFGNSVAQRLHPITGSSVMAQKRNPDAIELLRAFATQMGGLQQSTYGLLSGTPSGYNRDGREVKEYIASGISKTKTALQVLGKVFSEISFNEERMLQMVRSNYSLTTDLADYLAQLSNEPYRIVYKIVGRTVDQLMESGQSLEEIQIEKLNAIAAEFKIRFAISQAELISVIDPHKAIQRRKSIGSPNKEIVIDGFNRRERKKSDNRNWLKAHLERIASARTKTEQAINEIN